jgi:hypothetical protein
VLKLLGIYSIIADSAHIVILCPYEEELFPIAIYKIYSEFRDIILKKKYFLGLVKYCNYF